MKLLANKVAELSHMHCNCLRSTFQQGCLLLSMHIKVKENVYKA